MWLTNAVALLAALSPDTSTGWVWWEGEAAHETNFPSRTWFSETTFEETRHEILSGGAWLTNDGVREGEEAFARYRVEVPETGEYTLWARKFWKHGPFRWRFDRGEWRVCGRDVGLADSAEIRQHLCVNWVSLGRVKLRKGRHDFELRLLAREGESLTACFDCFLLTRQPFLPRGRLKPGESSGKVEPGWWAVEPAPDPFGEALLDLRHLNEKNAGESGFVTRSEGEAAAGFLLGDGQPVRFWAVNCGPDIVRLGRDSVDYLARRLAKLGVNLVRIHGPIYDRGADDPSTVDREYLDDLHYFVGALKREGIYSALSFYFPLWVQVRREYGIEGYEGIANKHPFALIFHDERLQEIYYAWARVLLTTKNPYTGRPLAKEPAVALVELVNEDSYFFWTFSPGETIPLAAMESLEREFGAWLVERHGSLEAAFRHWDGVRRGRDDERTGRIELLGAWHMTGAGCGEGGSRRRASDQVRFLTERMRRFYSEAIERLRALGCKSLISCGNWHTADARVLGPLERYAYTVGDVIDQHGYFGGRHEGEGAAWSVRVGHQFEDRSGLFEPEALPLACVQVAGHPQILSEIGWPNPNRFKAEFPVLCALYGALQGIDGMVLFAVNGPGWSASVDKFQLNVPSVMGQFPACALIYRRGYVSEAETIFHEELDLEALYDLEGAALVEAQALDALRQADVPEGDAQRGSGLSGLDPLLFFAGRVERSFGANGGGLTTSGALDELVTRQRRMVSSATEELELEYDTGNVLFATPYAEGACGFLGSASLDLLRVDCENDYSSILAVSLDGRPLASSREILIQAATEERPYGWRVEKGRIADLGGYPLLARELDARITLEGGARLRSAIVLDVHGYERSRLEIETRGEDAVLTLPRDALYTILRAR